MCVSERGGAGRGGDGGEGERVGWCKGFLLSLHWVHLLMESSCGLR